MGTHADPDHAEFRDATLSAKPFRTDFLDDRAKMLIDFRQLVREHRKGDIGGTRCGDVLHDHVNVDVNRRNLVEDSRGDARFVRYMADSDLRLFAVNAYSADDHFFHTTRL